MNLFRSFFSALVPLLLLSSMTYAQQRSETEAAAIAADFLQRETGTATPPRLTMLPRQHLATQIRRQMQRPFTGYAMRTGFFVFNADDGGFVIVGADNRQRDVLAYCTEGAFDGADMPCGLTALLEQYNREYELLGNGSAQQAASSPAYVQTKAVTPLIKTKWDQLIPYNTYCPIDPSTNKRCYTGCVATAMSQVMYYHRYPSSPADSVVSYVSAYDDNRKINLNKRLSTIPLNWSSMLQVYKDVSYSDAQGKAVANLMYAAGLSVQMSYSSEASSAFCPDEAYALIHFFGYNSNMRYVRQKYYTSEGWIRLIEEELSAGRPILYSGHSEPDENGKSSGHAFIVDGIDSQGRCHVNWGWSGKYQESNGAYVYYALSSFKPGSSDYSQDHEMVIGIDKTTSGNKEITFFAEEFNINGWQQGFNVGATASFTCTPWCYDSHANTYHTPVWCHVVYGVVDTENNNKLSLLTDLQEQALPYKIWEGYKLNKDVTFDASHFQEGHTYKIYPAIINMQKDRWYGVHTKGDASNYYVARVKGGKVYLGKMKTPTLPGEDDVPKISCVSQTCDNSNLTTVKPGERLILHAVYKNEGAQVTTDTRVRIFNSEIKGVYYTDSKSYTFKSNAQTTVDGSITLPNDIPEGDYYATLQYYRSWGDDPSWMYFKEKLIAFTVSNSTAPKETTVKTSSAGYATFYDSQTSYVLPSGLTAYVVITASGGSLTYKNIAEGSQSGIVPKGTAVMLKGGQSKTYKLTATNASASYTGTNLLRGSDTSTTTTTPSSSGYLFYKLSFGHSGTAYANAFGWYWGTSYGGAFYIDGHKAWLPLKESSTRAAYLPLDNLEDGIEGPTPDSSHEEREATGVWYDLGGRRVESEPWHQGIYVKDGKKVLVK